MIKIKLLATILLAIILHADAQAPASCSNTSPYLPIKDVKKPNQYYVCFDELSKPQLKLCPKSYEFSDDTLSCVTSLPVPPVPSKDKCTKLKEKFNDPVGNVDGHCSSYKECVKPAGSNEFQLEDKECLKGQLFNTIINDCVPPSDWYCADDGPDCDDKIYQNKRILDKADCHGLYECVGDARVKKSCGPVQVFDFTTNTCSTKRECKTAEISKPSFPSNKDICKGKPTQFVADPNYCMGYFYCVNDKTPYWSICQSKQYFNNGSCTSNRPNTCRCEGVVFDALHPKVNVPHLEKNKYYVCEEGKAPAVRICPSGTTFNKDAKSCM